MTAVQDKAERYSEAEELAQRHEKLKLPALSVSDAADVEDAAKRLRSDWHLGRDAIPSMVALLEDMITSMPVLCNQMVVRSSWFGLEPRWIESDSLSPTSWATWSCDIRQESYQRDWPTALPGHSWFPLIPRFMNWVSTVIT
jgi:hypothetical protein